jgi:carbon monoxide dehydrogenase subunit G
VRIGGTRRLPSSRERVWHALTDPEELASLMPGLDHIEVETDDEWTALVKPPFAHGLSLKFAMRVTDRRPLEHARLLAWGKSLGGRIAIQTEFELADDDVGTQMAWSAEVRLAGLLRGFAGRALEPLARQQAERVLDRLESRVTSS